MSEEVIAVENLCKTYRTPFRKRRVEAVKEISFTVRQGEVFGFLGPNGAGKTTTIRMLMGLIKPTAGEAKIFGRRIPSREARGNLGFVPEAPYFYEYLTIGELLDLAGRLCGVPKATRAARGEQLIELVGLGHARDTRLKKYSKGMLQRAGIAQALINNPQLVVFDEPMSGLDPIGRKEVRDIIHGLSEEGKTVFFSSHILADVEMICDHVAMIIKGELQEKGALIDLMRADLGTEVAFRLNGDISEEAVARLSETAEKARRGEQELILILPPATDLDQLLADAREVGATIISVTPRRRTLEELFIERTQAPAKPEEGAQ